MCEYFFFRNECVLKNVFLSQVKDVCVQTREMEVITATHPEVQSCVQTVDTEVQSCVQTVDTEVQSCVQTVDTEVQTYLSFRLVRLGEDER